MYLKKKTPQKDMVLKEKFTDSFWLYSFEN